MAAALLNPRLTGDQASTNRDIKPPCTRFANTRLRRPILPPSIGRPGYARHSSRRFELKLFVVPILLFEPLEVVLSLFNRLFGIGDALFDLLLVDRRHRLAIDFVDVDLLDVAHR